jgi:hypothetical protein
MDGSGAPRFGWALTALCLAAGLLFFASLGELWPLADADLTVPRASLRERAREHLESLGFDLEGYRAASRIEVDTEALDHVARDLGRARAQAGVREGWPLVSYRVFLKKRGEPIGYRVLLHPSGAALGWTKALDDDHPAERIAIEQARAIAHEALTFGLGLDPAGLEERAASTSEEVAHRAHTLGYERPLATSPELRERVTLTIVGREVVSAARRLVVPDAARRAAVVRAAPAVALETLGFTLLSVGAAAAFFVCLGAIRDGSVSPRRVAVWPALAFTCSLAAQMLETANLFAHWEPLWPPWVSAFRYFVLRAGAQVWLPLSLLAVVAAGDALDARTGSGRGATLARLGRGGLFSAEVARDSGRGFLIGLLCGGVMAVGVLMLHQLVGAQTSLQPRGFFFYTLNSASPAATSLLFFLGVALTEELGYRYFAGTWLLHWTGRRWVAVLLPAVVYGLTHTRMDFLPPDGPFWARPLVLAAVGCVWGWAFLRYGALTVVLSHFTADLFIFNWPHLAADDPSARAVAALTVCIPLAPVVVGWIRRRARPGGQG